MPTRVRDKLQGEINSCDIPTIEAFQVWEKMRTSKKTKSSMTNELPARLRQEFGPELAGPASIIFNNIAQTGQWVSHWRHESAVPLKKTTEQPSDESDIRLISITYKLSQQMEKFVLAWLYYYIEDKLDRDQFGGARKHSIAHYLIEIMNFVLYNQDLCEPRATLLAAIDISKSFNNNDHSITITMLSDMGVPGWLLRIVASYLTNRTLSVRFKGSSSENKNMPGGTPAGTILGLNLFLILFNYAGSQPIILA